MMNARCSGAALVAVCVAALLGGCGDHGSPMAGDGGAQPPDDGPQWDGPQDAPQDLQVPDGPLQLDGQSQPDADSTVGWAQWPMPACPPPDAGACSIYTTTAETVTDTVTVLEWQRIVPAGSYDWDQAKAYCAGLVTDGGVAGWRLPTRFELVSIVDYWRDNPAIDPVAFPGTPSDFFWSSSPSITAYPSGAWGVHFSVGVTYGDDVLGANRVRCVR